MIWREIVKYSPENYAENGVYTKNEWISRSDIGHLTKVNPKVLRNHR